MNHTKILVWDIPTRVFHWLLAISFTGAYLTAESESWRLVHVTLGYTFGGLILFRLAWGLIGTRHARFSDFSFGPRRVLAYLRSVLGGTPEHHVGHNPAGSWAVVALLALVALTAVTGWANLNDVGPGWIEDVHEAAANATLAMVALHVAAVVVSSVLHRENLVRAMVTGMKRAAHAVPAAGTRWAVGLGLVALIAAFWLGVIPAPGLERGTGLAALPMPAQTAAAGRRHGERHHDDD